MSLIRNVAIANLVGACLFALPLVFSVLTERMTRGTFEYKSQGPILMEWEGTAMAKTKDIEVVRYHAKGLVETYNVFQQTAALRRRYESVLEESLGWLAAVAAVVLLVNSMLLFWFLRRGNARMAGA
jgi:hypothetical protein